MDDSKPFDISGEEEPEEQDEDYLEMGVADVIEEELDNTSFHDIKNITKKRIPTAERKTRGFMTKFERAKIIGVRAQQIALGAIPNIDLPEGHHLTPREIAREELSQKKTPIIIHRIHHDGRYEAWKVEELA